MGREHTGNDHRVWQGREEKYGSRGSRSGRDVDGRGMEMEGWGDNRGVVEWKTDTVRKSTGLTVICTDARRTGNLGA